MLDLVIDAAMADSLHEDALRMHPIPAWVITFCWPILWAAYRTNCRLALCMWNVSRQIRPRWLRFGLNHLRPARPNPFETAPADQGNERRTDRRR
jgi:hypothetical protein